MKFTLLTIDSIHTALKQLGKREPIDPANPLVSLAIIRHSVKSYTSNIAPELITVYCVYQLFETILLAKLGNERAASTHATLYLVQDYSSGNESLQAYSLLYYLYLRSDCELPSRPELGKLLGINERTLLRRIRLGLHHLMFEVIAAETKLSAPRPPLTLLPVEKTEYQANGFDGYG